MKHGLVWANRLTPILIGLTVVPLGIVGLILSGLSYVELSRSTRVNQERVLAPISLSIEKKVVGWKRTLEILSQNKNPETAAKILDKIPEISTLQFFSDTGALQFQENRPGILRTFTPDFNSKSVRSSAQARRFLVGSVLYPEEGGRRLPITYHHNGYVYAEMNLEFLDELFKKIPGHVWLSDFNGIIAQSHPGTFPPGKGIRIGVPSLNWDMVLSQSWTEIYKPVINMFIRFGLAILMVGLLSSWVGWIFSKRIKKVISHQERILTIGQMASVLGHEVRTGLAVIKNSLNLAKDSAPHPNALFQKHVEIILRQIDTSNKIVANLLNISRNRKIMLEKVSINELIQTLLHDLPTSEKIKINQELDKRLPSVRLDKEEFKHAMTNLVINSIQAVNESGIISIKTFKENKHVAVVVQDNGPGIRPQLLKRVTEPFFTTKSQGTGLGLAVVKKFVDSHSGRLIIKSQPGSGTEVRIVLGGLAS